ncbi:FAD-dependent oxidoreductase, partial [Rhodohalobacter sulfatireducens]
YHVGRESNSTYDETLNGVQKVRTHNHIFPGFVDPYIEPGNRQSGILPGVHDGDPGEEFSGDHRVQAYCYRMCLTDVDENKIEFAKPDGYDELHYELLFRNFEAGENRIPWLPGAMPNRKTDTNNRWGFSTNHINVNYE